jgi:hypothetical protein
MRNNAQYAKRGYQETGLFLYRGTAALKKGYGMCFDLDYLTTETGETAADAFGGRGLVEVAIPSASNSNRFAGVLTQDYAANPNARTIEIELALPGGCAMVAQRIISTSGVTRMTCIVDRTAGQGLSGLFGHGGLPGRGSAITLQTLAAATAGKLALTNVTGVATGVYNAATDLTTVTLAGAGTALGYVSAAVDASSYELTVLGGATAGTGVTRCTPGIYQVYQATGANTFTVQGNTGDGAMMTFLTKIDLLMLAYLEDGPESGLSEYVVPITGAAQQFVLNQGGTTFICGGITIAGDCTVNTLADPIVIGGAGQGTKKAFATLGNTVTSDYIITVTSGIVNSDTTTTMATIVMQNATACEAVLEWHGNLGPNTGGVWHDLHHVGATYT